jgi:3-oxoadipate enol-lactonase
VKVLTASVEHWARYWHALSEIDTTLRLRELHSPTSVIAAEHDKSTPPDEMRHLADQIPLAHFEVIPTAPHMTSLECPAETAQALVRHLARVRTLKATRPASET